ncbi:MAG TPA: hypothetical protein VEH07_04630, partial [Alphaproteobacteria bacterium]|nr:hypothetical protein [Alphaproteobacteria bacterium]
LLTDFGLDADWKAAIARIKQPTRVLVGSNDELFYPEAFAPAFASLNPRVAVNIVDGPDHMGIVLDRQALQQEVAEGRDLLAGNGSENCSGLPSD